MFYESLNVQNRMCELYAHFPKCGHIYIYIYIFIYYMICTYVPQVDHMMIVGMCQLIPVTDF